MLIPTVNSRAPGRGTVTALFQHDSLVASSKKPSLNPDRLLRSFTGCDSTRILSRLQAELMAAVFTPLMRTDALVLRACLGHLNSDGVSHKLDQEPSAPRNDARRCSMRVSRSRPTSLKCVDYSHQYSMCFITVTKFLTKATHEGFA